MSLNVYPTETPVGQLQSVDCNYVREYQMAAYMDRMHQSPLRSFLVSGYTLVPGTGLQVLIDAGIAIIEGRRVDEDAGGSVSGLTASNTNYIWLTLNFTGSLVTSATYSANITGTPPAHSVLIGLVYTGPATIISCANSAWDPGACYSGTYVGNGSSQLIVLGFHAKSVQVTGAPSSGIWAASGNPFGMNVIGADGIAGAVMVSDSDADVPVITAVGFTVSGGFNTLNQNGITYHFTAWS
jgi:hypothetical protein